MLNSGNRAAVLTPKPVNNLGVVVAETKALHAKMDDNKWKQIINQKEPPFKVAFFW